MRRKRVRAVDPYLGFYIESDPLSEPHGPSRKSAPPHTDESIQAPQSTNPIPRSPAPQTSTIQPVRSSSSPEPEPQASTHQGSHAARKRRRIDSDSDYAAEELSHADTRSSGDVEGSRPTRGPPATGSTRRLARTSTLPLGIEKPSRPKRHPDAARGPFTARMITACLATGVQLNDDLEDANARTMPRLKILQNPLPRSKRRVSSTQVDPPGGTRAVNFLPSFNTAADEQADVQLGRYGTYGAKEKARRRLSLHPVPAANRDLPLATLGGHEITPRPVTRKNNRCIVLSCGGLELC